MCTLSIFIPERVVSPGIALAISAMAFPSCCIGVAVGADIGANVGDDVGANVGDDVGANVGADVEKDTDHHLHRMKLFIQLS